MQNAILFGVLVLTMFACGYILQRPISKGLEPSERRITICVLSAIAVTILIAPTILPPLMAGWFFLASGTAAAFGVFGPTTFKAIRYAFEGAYGIKNSDK